MEAVKGPNLKLSARGRTDVGRKRPHNEDSIEVSESLTLFAVADGMGGHAAGEVASRAAIDALHEFIAQTRGADEDFPWPFGFSPELSPIENVLRNGVLLANSKVCQLAGENRDYSGMGTTMAALYAPGPALCIGHVGDSRIYQWRSGELKLLTMDHSWVNEQLQRHVITEDEARNHRWRNVITRALGNRIELQVDTQVIEPAAGDLFLLCSDGLTGMLLDEDIADLLTRHEDLDEAVGALIEAANEAGGLDNVSVILVRVDEASAG